jgi:hypothetical protein
MNGTHFDALVRVLTDRATTRRALTRGLTAGSLAAIFGQTAVDEADAHNRLAACRRIKQKRRRALCLRRARQHNAAHRTPPLVPPPTPVQCVADDCPDPGVCKVRACADNVCAPENVSDGTSCGSDRETCGGGVCCPFLHSNCFGRCVSLTCEGSLAGGCDQRCDVPGAACCGGLICRQTDSGQPRCRP